MRFIGQHHIMRQLKFILPDLVLNPNRGVNILLRGPSGYGKTTMALRICEYLSGKEFEVYLWDRNPFKFHRRVIFIDEVHKMSDFEQLYHIMDSKTLILIFATNADGNLPEAFSNRCYEFIFSNYEDDELLLMAREAAEFTAPDSEFMSIIEAGNRNPRIIINNLIAKLNTYFYMNKDIIPSSLDFKILMSTLFDIQDGLDTLCKRYLRVLDDVGGNASIGLLKSILHVDQATLTNQVEPILLQRGKIRISSKGRSLVYDNV